MENGIPIGDFQRENESEKEERRSRKASGDRSLASSFFSVSLASPHSIVLYLCLGDGRGHLERLDDDGEEEAARQK